MSSVEITRCNQLFFGNYLIEKIFFGNTVKTLRRIIYHHEFPKSSRLNISTISAQAKIECYSVKKEK